MAFIYDVHAHVEKNKGILIKQKKKTWKNKRKKIIEMLVQNVKRE